MSLPCKRFLGIKIVKYRIIKDMFHGYAPQKWRIYWPFWCGIDTSHNDPISFKTIEAAEKMIDMNMDIGRIVKT